MQPKLILTVGLPRSGKSTWAAQQGHPIVCPDAIRLALHGRAFVESAEPFVWAMAYLMVDALFRAGHPVVVVDATNVSDKRRKEWTRRWANSTFQIFDTAPAVCMARAHAEGRDELIPVIARMAGEWDLPKGDAWDIVP
jgi:predicted kinase